MSSVQKSLARLVLRRQQLELVEIADARVHVFVQPLHVRLVPLAHQVDLAAPLAIRIAERREQFDEFLPRDARVGRRLELFERGPQMVAGDEVIERALGIRRAHARHELQHAEAGELVVRIVGPAQHRQQILDVRGLEELEAAVFHERNLALRELDFEHVAVRAGAEQHGLALERNAGFARGQHARADELRLRRQVVDRHELRARTLAAHRQQVLAVLPRRIRHERIRRIEDALARTEVLRERDHLGLGPEAVRETRGCSRPRRRGTSR